MPISELLIKIGVSGAERAKRELREIKTDMASAAAGARSFVTAFSGIGATVAGLAAVGLAAGTVKSAFDAAASFDSLVRGLATVAGSADGTRRQLAALREVAKLPGLGLNEAIQGAIGLQSVGLSFVDSTNALLAFGNALASVGKGKSDLDGVILALTQIVSKGKVQAEEINQISERVPQIRAALKAAFGTADTEELQKSGIAVEDFVKRVSAQLLLLPKVSGGVKNDVENMSDAVQAALVPLGQGIIAFVNSLGAASGGGLTFITDQFRALGEIIAAVGKSGVALESIQRGFKGFAGLFGLDQIKGVRDLIVEITAGALSLLANLPSSVGALGKYLVQLTQALTANVGIAITSALGILDVKIKEFVLQKSVELNQLISQISPDLVPSALRPSALQQQRDAIAAAQQALPSFQPLPGLPDNLNPFRDQAAFAARIRASLGPLKDLPDGLIFGSPAPSGQGQQQTGILEKIEQHTKETADSLAKSINGGGPLAKLGVTPAELGGRGLVGLLGAALEQEIDRRVNARLATAGGTRFRP